MDRLNPIEMLRENWRNALQHHDPNARYCTMATMELDEHGIKPRTRTLVLRAVTDTHCLLYVNRRSKKNLDNLDNFDNFDNQAQNHIELLLFYPTLMEQYRVRGQLSFMNAQAIEDHWQHKPRGSKLLDRYYAEQQAQSSALTSREAFDQDIQRLSNQFTDTKDIPYHADAIGLELKPDYIETWKADDAGFHHRALYQLTEDRWSKEDLVP